MWKKAFLTATVAGALLVGSGAAFAQTTVDTDDVPAIAVQTELQTEAQLQDPALVASEDALLTQTATQTRSQLRIDAPAECDGECDPTMTQQRAELRVGTATQAGDMVRDRLQLQDPLAHDGDFVGNGIGDGSGDCDEEPRNTLAEDGTGNRFGGNK
ncbi:MAG: hypothetical protein QNL12_12510 [Acidimicrobiia bacterium]|nr:hypothetical protein [Acidimicrobiia bacterium]MDX2468132.1 hypothetical protein [Acidimicrobiia bacterium]